MKFDYSEAVAEIKSQISMQDLLSFYGFELNRYNEMCCPFHVEKTPSFRVYQDNYYCFGCHEHGDNISFVMKHEKISFAGALHFLNDKFNLGLNLKKAVYENNQASRISNVEREIDRLCQRRKHLHYAIVNPGISDNVSVCDAITEMQMIDQRLHELGFWKLDENGLIL